MMYRYAKRFVLQRGIRELEHLGSFPIVASLKMKRHVVFTRAFIGNRTPLIATPTEEFYH